MSEQALKEIKEQLDRIEKICERMDRHISFVDRVYDGFEAPLAFVKAQFENTFGIKTLPVKDGKA